MRCARAMMVFMALAALVGCHRDRAETAAEPTAAPQTPEAAETGAAGVVEEAEAAPAAEESARVVGGPNGEAAIFPASHPLVGRGEGRWTPTDADVALAEELIAEQLPTLWSDARDDEPAELGRYRRQYFGVVDAQGQRRLWVNFFRSDSGDDDRWTRGEISFRGGGRDYFNLKVELEARRCGALSVNGPR